MQKIERYIQTVKGRIRAQWCRLPYRAKIIRVITTELVKQSITWFNSFPLKEGVNEISLPIVIMTRIKMDYKKYYRMLFGDYVQVYEK